jgi:mannose-6-phosphate isomerase-like protein (cupin superfamily)
VVGSDFDLSMLLRPVGPEAFFRDYWEKEPLAVARDDPGYYRGLFSLRDVDAVIAFTRPKFTAPDDFRPAGPAGRNFVQGFLPDDEASPSVLYPDLAEVGRAFARGKTLVLTAMQCRWGPVAALCRHLEGYFGCPVHTNLYLTPPGAKGFDAHYDTHEVFVLQIEGTKHWRFYGAARELPLTEERATFSPDQLGPPTQEVTVRPGDLLYMPRGHTHEAFTSESLSLHLTVGVKVYRWVELLHQALDAVSARDVRFRASLPPGLLTDSPLPAAADGRLRELALALAEQGRADEAVGRLAADFLGTLAALPGNSFTAVDAEGIGPDTVVEHIPGAVCREVRLPDGRVGLQFPGGSLEGPPKIAAALHFVAHTRRFAVGSLPGGLSPDGKLVLVRRLVRDGLLTVLSTPPPGSG